VPFATAFGITLPFAKNKWRMDPVDVGAADERVDRGSLVRSRTARKREWSTSTTIGTQAERVALRRLLEGDGLHVDFDDASGFSFSGIGPKTSASCVFSSSSGKRGGKVQVGSTAVLEYGLAELMGQEDGAWAPTKGFTVAVHKFVSGSWRDYIATGSVVVTRGASSGNPVGVTQYENGLAGAHAMGNWLSVDADGDVGIHGYDAAGSGAAFDFDELLVWPFALPPSVMATWASALNTFRASRSVGRLPHVLLSGDCILDASPLEVTCRLEASELDQAAFDGAYHSTSTRDEYRIRQV
jgi:hypothetical protein